MAYADDITLFSINIQDLQNLIDVCVAYSKRWKLKFGFEKSKYSIVGKCSLYQEPKWKLGDKINICVMKNCLMYMVMCLIVIMPATSPTY